MNKSTLILVALSGLAGFSLVWMWLTGFNPVTAITQFISNPAAAISELVSLFTQRLDVVAPVVAVISGAVALGSHLIKQVKSTAKEGQDILKGQMLEMDQAKANIEAELIVNKEVVARQTTKITTLESEKTKDAKTIRDQALTIQRLQNDLSYGTKAEKDWVKQEIQEATRVK